MSYAAVHIPEFPVVAWTHRSPELRSEPLVVVEGVPPQEMVISLNQRARALGIERGMSKVQAEASGAVLYCPRDIDKELAVFTRVLEIAERFSPRVEAVRAPANAYGGGRRLSVLLFLDSSGTGILFGSAESYARKLYEEMKAASFPAGIGTAPNAEAALLLARACRQVVSANRDNLPAKLAPLPTALLPCEPKVLAVLSRWGIRTLGEVAALPETALVSRLGQQGRRLQQLARGEADRLLVPEEPEFTLSETASFDSPVELLDSLLFVLSPMLDTILRRAAERAYALRVVRLSLQLERGQPHTLTVRPATATQNREVLLKLLHLELQASPPASGIMAITLGAEPAHRRRPSVAFSKPSSRSRTSSSCCLPGYVPSQANRTSVPPHC